MVRHWQDKARTRLPYRASERGFTLVELVMVIILIGVLSVGASSLFSSREAYSGFIAKDQLISSGMLAQQIALGMSAINNPVSLRVSRETRNGEDTWVFGLTKTGMATRELTQASSGSAIQVDGSSLGLGSSVTFTWNSQAGLADNTAHSVYFVGEQTFRVCFSASGYVYESEGVCP